MPEYVDTHGDTLFREYARSKLALEHPGGKSGVSGQIVEQMTRHVRARFNEHPEHKKVTALKTMYNHVVMREPNL